MNKSDPEQSFHKRDKILSPPPPRGVYILYISLFSAKGRELKVRIQYLRRRPDCTCCATHFLPPASPDHFVLDTGPKQ